MLKNILLIALLVQLSGCIITPRFEFADSRDVGKINFDAPPPPYTDPPTWADKMCDA